MPLVFDVVLRLRKREEICRLPLEMLFMLEIIE